MRAVADRLAARLRVHACSAADGYRQDPQADETDEDTPDWPGMSSRWCVLDQYALADYERAIAEADIVGR